jgi:L-seryl-tRNA(Ser) seleniumtransferase
MKSKEELKKIPGVDLLLKQEKIVKLLEAHPRALVTHHIQHVLASTRDDLLAGKTAPSVDIISDMVYNAVTTFTKKSLRPVINATGVIVHTNLGRAPFGDQLLADVQQILRSYNNLEFDLDNAQRGSRYVHVTNLMKYLTGAEDVLVVNNNAAAVMLILRCFAKGREVIISRSELIEIGGAFRMPDIMQASDCKMVEVGTTNKTKASDFEQAITEDTAIIMKAHKSNYVIKGFTTEPSLEALAAIGKKSGKIVVYDMGSGLLQKAAVKFLQGEPDVKATLAKGIDLVTFSGDKLLGGPQAGIIAGRKDLIDKLKKEPLTRAVRVGKTVLAILESVCLSYLDQKALIEKNPVFAMMNAGEAELQAKAGQLQTELAKHGVTTDIVKSFGQAGGGALPEKTIKSLGVRLLIDSASRSEKTAKAERIYSNLLKHETPVLGVLRKGELIFDVLTIPAADLCAAAGVIGQVYEEVNHA